MRTQMTEQTDGLLRRKKIQFNIWGEEESVPSLEHNYESEEEVQTVGDSDTTTSNSSIEVEVLEQTSDDN